MQKKGESMIFSLRHFFLVRWRKDVTENGLQVKCWMILQLTQVQEVVRPGGTSDLGNLTPHHTFKMDFVLVFRKHRECETALLFLSFLILGSTWPSANRRQRWLCPLRPPATQAARYMMYEGLNSVRSKKVVTYSLSHEHVAANFSFRWYELRSQDSPVCSS